MSDDAKAALKKRLVELLIAALTALITALATGCALKWGSNSFEAHPLGWWQYSSHNPEALREAAPAAPVTKDP